MWALFCCWYFSWLVKNYKTDTRFTVLWNWPKWSLIVDRWSSFYRWWKFRFPDVRALCCNKKSGVLTAVYGDRSIYSWQQLADGGAISKISSQLFHAAPIFALEVSHWCSLFVKNLKIFPLYKRRQQDFEWQAVQYISPKIEHLSSILPFNTFYRPLEILNRYH